MGGRGLQEEGHDINHVNFYEAYQPSHKDFNF